MWSRRCLATLLQVGLSHVRRSNCLFWRVDVLGHTTQFLVTAYNGNSRFFQISSPFSTFSLALHFCLNDETHTFPKFATFIRLVFDTVGRMPIIAWYFSGLFRLLHLFHLYCLCLMTLVGEGEHGHVCLYLCLSCSCHVRNCMTLLWNTFPFAYLCPQSPVFPSSLLLLSSALRLLGAVLAVLLFRASKFRSFVTWSKNLLTLFFILLYCILVVQCKCGLQLFRM